jgi:excisionase family DNA binding protein
MKRTYSTAGLAKLLSVNESTIKRWSDTGDLPCVKTRGGHRRFPIASVMEFVRTNKLSANVLAIDTIENEDLQAHVLVGHTDKLLPDMKREMLSGDVQAVLRILRIAFAAKPNLLELYEQLVFAPLSEIGEQWHCRTLTIDKEHIASNTLQEALALFQAEIYHKEPHGLTALCACYETELHDIVLRCIAYFLEVEGWKVLFLGQLSPVNAIVQSIKTKKPHLVALSATIVNNERKFLNAVNHRIQPVARRVRAKFVVGGHRIKERFSDRIKADCLCDSIRDCEELANPNNYKRTA